MQTSNNPSVATARGVIRKPRAYIGRFTTNAQRAAITGLDAVFELLEQGQFLLHHLLELYRVVSSEYDLLALQYGLDQAQVVQACLHGRGKGLYELSALHPASGLAKPGLEGQHLVGDTRGLDFV